jgi:hypothetical protein
VHGLSINVIYRSCYLLKLEKVSYEWFQIIAVRTTYFESACGHYKIGVNAYSPFGNTQEEYEVGMDGMDLQILRHKSATI